MVVPKVEEAGEDKGGDGSSEKSLHVLPQEKVSRNKRKFEFPLDTAKDSPALPLAEFQRYELLEEKLRNALIELKSLNQRSDQSNVKRGTGESPQQADWDDPMTGQLEALLICNLNYAFQSAIKKIVECGYNEELAEWAILSSGLYLGSKDIISNIVDGALGLLTNEKDLQTSKHLLFDSLEGLIGYVMLEMVYALREVKPFLTVAEAMWCLLICDLNLLHACELEGDTLHQFCSREHPVECSCGAKLSQLKKETSRGSRSNPEKLCISTSSFRTSQNLQSKTVTAGATPQSLETSCSCEVAITRKHSSVPLPEMEGTSSGVSRANLLAASQARVSEEKSGAGRKGSSVNSRKDLLLQKTPHFEKGNKGCKGKGVPKTRLTTSGGMSLDKTLNSQSGPSVLRKKSSSSKITTGETTAPCTERNHQALKNSASVASATDRVGVSPIQNFVSGLPAVNSKAPAVLAQEILKAPGNIPSSSAVPDNRADIPYDESLGKYVPQNEKDEMIVMLILHKQQLQKEIQGWTDWTNEKVRQAAQRLGKDQAELRMLRQEREEVDKFQKDKAMLEENAMKRLSEMEHALSSVGGQMEMANSYLRRLEAEHTVLKKGISAAKLISVCSSKNLQEAKPREQEVLKKCQTLEVEKGSLQGEFAALKGEEANFQRQLEKARRRQNQIEALWQQEEKEKKKFLEQAESLRNERKQLGDLAKVEEDNMRAMAESNMLKCKEFINKLNTEISALRLESEASKIEALRRGTGMGYSSCTKDFKTVSKCEGMQNPMITDRLAALGDYSGKGGMKRERECVMCLAEEMSVVFLPCAHQVLCKDCNVLHEKQGMNDCPSCRTPITKRINVRLAPPRAP